MSTGQWRNTGSGKESWVQLKFQEQQEAAAGDDRAEGCWDIRLTKHSGSFIKGGGDTFSGMMEEIHSYQVEEIL